MQNNSKECGKKNCLMAGVALLAGVVVAGCLGAAIYFSSQHPKESPAKYALHPKQLHWAFDGVLGTVDRAAAQRGFQVYKEVCSNCHGLQRVAFRNLADLGFGEDEIKALAKEATFKTLSDAGEVVERTGLPSDHFVPPFPNEQASRAANNGAYPPDLSLMVKARHDGANYIYSLITGYENPPANFPLSEGMQCNPYFEGRQIAMIPPLSAGVVTYADGTPATVDQMGQDVVTFLQWAAEPEMEQRKAMGLRVMTFLAIGAIFFWIAKRRVWKDVH
jgi:ubiquinol-cytochrome c reductase cytochrome c1 subunit